MGRNPKKQKVEIFRYVPPAPAPPPAPRPTQYVELSRHYETGTSGAPVLVSQRQLHLPPSPVKKSSTALSLGSRQSDRFSIPVEDADGPNFDTLPSDLDWDGDPLPNLVEDSDGDSDIDDNNNDSGEEAEGPDDEPSRAETQAKKRKRRPIGDNPFLHFIPKIDMFVEEMLRLEAPGNATLSCSTCCVPLESGSAHRCRDCVSPPVMCGPCIVSSHLHVPFHRVETWQGSFFQRSTLKALGLRVQLGHPAGETCLLPAPASQAGFVVIDSDGIHTIDLDFCGCHQTIPRLRQLIRFRLFPASTVHPKSAATFRVLETYQMLSFTSRVSAYEFIKSIERRTDNTGTRKVPDRYTVWLRIVREWRHVRLLKRMGRGHDPTGAAGTAPGELAVLCPACPYPDINLPADYEQLAESDQWKYTLFLGMDANFRLRRVKVSSEEHDPGLSKGYSFIVDEAPFKAYLSKYNAKIEDDKSDCRNHDAIKSASIRGGKGQAASGMGTVQCARHDMKRPLGNGDLQKGERYVNMDYFFLSTLSFKTPRSVAISYDIACQWSKNLEERCEVYDPNPISNSSDLELRFFVLKFHLPAHVVDCQLGYSFNYLPRVGRTDGEAPERSWSLFNALAYSTREMGPGSRRDTLDDNFGDHNWVKITKLAISFKERAVDAIAARKDQMAAFVAFSKALPLEIVGRWTGDVQAWERDPCLETSPFRQEGDGKTEAEVRRELAEEDRKVLEEEEGAPLHNVSPSELIGKAIEIEDQQRRLAIDTKALGPHSTDLQHAKVLERSNALKRKIDGWMAIQHIYMPSLALLRKQEEEEGTGSEATSVQEIKLLLPSSVSRRVDIPGRFKTLELRYRKAQGFSTLRELRAQLLLKSHMLHSKKTHVLGNLESRIGSTAEKYRYVHSCLSALSPDENAGWRQELLPLRAEDVKVLTLDQEGGEGHRALTWIWKVKGTVAMKDDPEVQAALRVEWCKTRARAHRWQEECLLLAEEMRRVMCFFEWQISEWDARGKIVAKRPAQTVPEGTPAAIVEMNQRADADIDRGRLAFAARTADMWTRMLETVRTAWEGLEGILVAHPVFVEDNRLD